MNAELAVLAAAAITVAATIAGAAVSIRRPPGAVARSHVHHAAAGAVFAAVASELVFDLIERRRLWPVAIGFILGTAAMLAVRAAAERLEARGGDDSTSLLAATATDVLIDGFVLGIGFAAGARGGLLLTAALTLELVFLGVSIAAALGSDQTQPRRVLATTSAVALLLPLGGLAGALLGGVELVVDPILAFGAAALLFLVTEELLKEAHEQESAETPTATAAFFAAFLAILLLDIATR